MRWLIPLLCVIRASDLFATVEQDGAGGCVVVHLTCQHATVTYISGTVTTKDSSVIHAERLRLIATHSASNAYVMDCGSALTMEQAAWLYTQRPFAYCIVDFQVKHHAREISTATEAWYLKRFGQIEDEEYAKISTPEKQLTN
jgi:hypothetical protein